MKNEASLKLEEAIHLMKKISCSMQNAKAGLYSGKGGGGLLIERILRLPCGDLFSGEPFLGGEGTISTSKDTVALHDHTIVRAM